MQRIFAFVLASIAALAGQPASADPGDILLKARGTYHQRLNNFAIMLPEEDVPVDAEIQNTAGAEAAIALFFTDNIAAEFSLGGAGYQVTESKGRGLVSANLLMSTATLQYHIAPDGKRIRPYIGLGVTHLNLYGEDTEVDSKNPAPDSFSSYNSRITGGFAPVAQAGADVAMGDQLFINLDIKYTARKTELMIEREVRATEVRRLGALIVGLGIGFRF